jgi:hypothetical protein
MNLPTFTATVSIYQSKAHYPSSTRGNSQSPIVVPAVGGQSAASARDLCVSSCVQTCKTQTGNYEDCLQDCQARCQAGTPAGGKKFG